MSDVGKRLIQAAKEAAAMARGETPTTALSMEDRMTERKFTGSMTDVDGNRRALSEEEARNIWYDCDRAAAERINDMPDFSTAIDALHSAKTRLGELGWKDAVNCPKDGRTFAIIEYGSTGIFAASYSGEWPDGYLLYQDCVGHPKGCMWKPIEALSEQEAERLKQCSENHSKFMEREVRMWGAIANEDAPRPRRLGVRPPPCCPRL